MFPHLILPTRHHYHLNVVVPDHTPEVIDGVREWALGCYVRDISLGILWGTVGVAVGILVGVAVGILVGVSGCE